MPSLETYTLEQNPFPEAQLHDEARRIVSIIDRLLAAWAEPAPIAPPGALLPLLSPVSSPPSSPPLEPPDHSFQSDEGELGQVEEELEGGDEDSESDEALMQPLDPAPLQLNEQNGLAVHSGWAEFMQRHVPALHIPLPPPTHGFAGQSSETVYARLFQEYPYDLQAPRLPAALTARAYGLGFGPAVARGSAVMSRIRESATAAVFVPAQLRRPACHLASPHLVQPRQFEYHPRDPGIMAIGTSRGLLSLHNPHAGRELAQVQVSRPNSAVLSISFLHHRNHMLVGAADGQTVLVGTEELANHTPPVLHSFPPFDRLTCLHVSMDDRFYLACGYQRLVQIVDVESSQPIRTFPDIHESHINVCKFSYQNPSLFATCSFDCTTKLWDLREPNTTPIWSYQSNNGNVMCLFSPDDRHVLASGEDNELVQIDVGSGQAALIYRLTKSNIPQNYTRAYYSASGSHLIAGSCQENIVRLLETTHGRTLANVELCAHQDDLYVQSLRPDLHHEFRLGVLAANSFNSNGSQVLEIDLLRELGPMGPGQQAPPPFYE